MKEELVKLIQEKSPGSIPIYLVIRGSHAYGTNIETSDTDYSGIFVQSMDDILGSNYIEQINDDKNDIVIYEIQRFLELLSKNNPTILELLNTPKDCVIYKHPIFDEVLTNRDKFITKVCANSFGGYARQQISKARGQNKKQNWEMNRVVRKNPIDFCYVIGGNETKNGSYPLLKWLDERNYSQEECGLVNVDNARDIYAVYWDDVSTCNYLDDNPIVIHGKYKGIVNEKSNELLLSSIEKGTFPVFFISYNKDGYTKHCKDYNSYQKWLTERNEARWVDVKSHQQKIDGKNMMHCRRLMDMAREIGEGKGINVRRENAEELIDIRKGKVDLETLINHVESEVKEIDTIYKNSNLPDSVDEEFVENILLDIRKTIYELN